MGRVHQGAVELDLEQADEFFVGLVISGDPRSDPRSQVDFFGVFFSPVF